MIRRPLVLCDGAASGPRRRAAACAIVAWLSPLPALAEEQEAPPAPAPVHDLPRLPGSPGTPGSAPMPPVHDGGSPGTPGSAPIPPAPADITAELRALGRSIDMDMRVFGSIELGRGLRFNNPYRLATELGTSAESVSLTASYADLGAGVTFGPPDGVQYGGAVHASLALAGVSQAVITPGFVVAYRGPRPFMTYGRVAPSFVLTPQTTFGAEVAGGFAWFLTSKIAVAGELVFDLYYGAGTYQVAIATYPIVSGQIGLLFDQEILP